MDTPVLPVEQVTDAVIFHNAHHTIKRLKGQPAFKQEICAVSHFGYSKVKFMTTHPKMQVCHIWASNWKNSLHMEPWTFISLKSQQWPLSLLEVHVQGAYSIILQNLLSTTDRWSPFLGRDYSSYKWSGYVTLDIYSLWIILSSLGTDMNEEREQ